MRAVLLHAFCSVSKRCGDLPRPQAHARWGGCLKQGLLVPEVVISLPTSVFLQCLPMPVTHQQPGISTLACLCPGLGAQRVVEAPGHVLGEKEAEVFLQHVPHSGSGSPGCQGSHRLQVDLPDHASSSLCAGPKGRAGFNPPQCHFLAV